MNTHKADAALCVKPNCNKAKLCLTNKTKKEIRKENDINNVNLDTW